MDRSAILRCVGRRIGGAIHDNTSAFTRTLTATHIILATHTDMFLRTAILLVLLCCQASSFAQAPPASRSLAFPSAEGYGKYTVGGRGGRVYEVTNLNDSGEGSLRDAVEAKGPRTVVFRVSGTIKLESEIRIRNPNITIAGQTAPGGGICLRGYPLMISADEVIIRYLRVRFGDESGKDADAISARYVKNLILDHVSASWSVDETMSIYHCENMTVQWCIISESMFSSNHGKGQHGFGGIWGSNHSTYHHNLLAHHSSRNPRFASGCGNTDYRNNVVYNWGYASCYGAEAKQKGKDKFNFSKVNMVGNYYKPGPATDPARKAQLAAPSSRGADDKGSWHVAGNVVEGSPEVTANNWSGLRGDNFIKLDEPWKAMPIRQQTATEAFKSVLAHAGATLPKRDAVDARIIQEVRRGTATYEGIYKTRKRVADKSKITGIIDSQKDVGGWPELKSVPAPKDSDHDGMPDEWEVSKGLNPNDGTDRNKIAAAGYTMLEVYLNSMK
ncbi:MAG: pectate lyase [Planctomycetaceae bacterium]